MPSNGTIHLEYEGYDGRGIKQADVILLGYPLNWKGLTKQSRRADLEFYEKVTDKNGPSMTWSMHTVGFLELDGKETEKSKDLFKRSYATVQQPYYVWREGLTGGAINFITGAGGFLQAYLNGYGGLRINKSSLTFNPILSDGTVFTRLRGVNYLGNVFNVEYDEHTVSITLLSGNSLIVTDAKGQKTRLEVGNSHKMVKSAFSVTNK
jgi:trehalose/maltose hydrolase-like predicted phosphorylase